MAEVIVQMRAELAQAQAQIAKYEQALNALCERAVKVPNAMKAPAADQKTTRIEAPNYDLVGWQT